MSARRKTAGNAPSPGAAASGPTSQADQIRAMIEQAKLANQSFMMSNPQLSTGSAPTSYDYDLDHEAMGIDAPPNFIQRMGERNNPFQLEFNQKLEESTINQGEFTVKLTVTLSNGVFSRLVPMMNDLSTKFEPFFKANGFEIRMSGTMYKVCSRPSKSTVEWAFAKAVDGEDLKKIKAGEFQFWVLPAMKRTPFALLKFVFNDDKSKTNPNGMVDGTKYEFVRQGKSVPGERAVFNLQLLQ